MSFFSSIAAFFTSIRDWFASPATTQAVKNIEATVETVSEAIVCDIAAGAALAASIMDQVSVGNSTKGTTQEIYVISSSVCKALEGVVVPNVTAQNVPAVTAVSSS